jgi:membrane fusion protein, heavy metal efflux system
MTMNRILMTVLFLLLTACHSHDPHEVDHGHDHGAEAAAPEPEKGPHRGRMLRDGDFALEVAIFESGVPPEFHLYATQAGQPVPPEQVKAQIELIRLGDPRDTFTFVAEGDHLKGSGVVKEPHSFEVKVRAEHAGSTYEWTYESFEGRTRIAEKVAQDAGIKAEPAGPGVIHETIALYGSIQPNADRVRRIVPRFPGPIRSVDVQVGDTVVAGQTLATVESNDSLRSYTVTAPIGGIVIERHGGPGESAGSTPLFVVADLSSVWAEFAVFPRDRARIKVGQAAVIADTASDLTGHGTIAYVAPLGMQANQSQIARIVLDNADGSWVPGTFVTTEVTVGEHPKDLVVRNDALHGFRDFTVVFAKVGDQYEVRMLELGQADAEHVEVLGGLIPGTLYVTENSYLIKADVEKSGASHDH